MKKIVIAITGASGSIYAKNLLEKLLILKDQWTELSVVMSENAKEVWLTELENETYTMGKLILMRLLHLDRANMIQ